MSDLLEAALSYAARGWHVVPLHSVRDDGTCTCVDPGSAVACSARNPSPGKHPIPWNGLTSASADPERVRAWWAEFPNANVGIVCGPSGLAVLDVDVKQNAGGMESLAELDAELTHTLTSRTGSGGLHAVYARPDGVAAGNRIRFRPGLDLIARGYIVAPPSRHASGGRYEWVDLGTPLAALPPALVAALGPGRPPDAAGPAGEYPPAPPELLERARARLLEHGPAVKGQGGDLHTYRVGAILMHDFALSWEQAWPLAIWWNVQFPENTWSLDRLEAKVRNGGRYAQGARGAARERWEFAREMSGGAAEPDPPSLLPVPGVPEPEPGTWEHDLATALAEVRSALASAPDESSPAPLFEPANDLIARPHPQTVWLVNGLVKEGGTLVVSGEPKTGKSWVLTEIAMALATGTEAFGHFRPPSAGAVAYFYAEDLAPDVAAHLRALAAGRGLDPSEACRNLHVQPRGRFLDVTRDEDLALVVASARRIAGLRLLILEPLRDLHSGEEDKSDSMRDVMRRLRLLGELLRCTIGIAHHSAKSSVDTTRRRQGQKMRGSSAIHGSIDSGVYLSGLDGDGERVLTNRVQSEVKGARSAGHFDLTLEIEDGADGTAVKAAWLWSRPSDKEGGTGEEESLAMLRARVLEVLRRDGASPASRVVKSFSGSKMKGARRDNLLALLDAMYTSGLVRRDDVHPFTKGGRLPGGGWYYWLPGFENPEPVEGGPPVGPVNGARPPVADPALAGFPGRVV